MDITQAINTVQSHWLEISGIRSAPNTLPQSASAYPFASTYEGAFEVDLSEPYTSEWGPHMETIVSELHLANALERSRAIASAMTYRNPFMQKIQADPNLGDNVILALRIRSSGIIDMEWDGVPTIGYRFEIDVVLELQAA